MHTSFHRWFKRVFIAHFISLVVQARVSCTLHFIAGSSACFLHTSLILSVVLFPAFAEFVQTVHGHLFSSTSLSQFSSASVYLFSSTSVYLFSSTSVNLFSSTSVYLFPLSPSSCFPLPLSTCFLIAIYLFTSIFLYLYVPVFLCLCLPVCLSYLPVFLYLIYLISSTSVCLFSSP